jgi:hypothetical protein
MFSKEAWIGKGKTQRSVIHTVGKIDEHHVFLLTHTPYISNAL